MSDIMLKRLLSGTLAVLAGMAQAAFPVVNDGKAEAVIAIPEMPTVAERFAAEELQSLLREMTQVEVPIVPGSVAPEQNAFILGRHPENTAVIAEFAARYPEAYDGFAMVTEGNRTHLASGRSAVSLAWAVWEWLERQEVDFLMPGKYGRYIPKKRTVWADDIAFYTVPAVELRRAWYFLGTGAAYEVNWGCPESLMAENEHGFSAGEIWNMRVRTSVVSPEPADLVPNVGAGHSYSAYLPASRYDESHPEFMNFRHGRRLNRHDPEVQVCFTNPEAAAEFARNITPEIEACLARGIPMERIRICVSPNDAPALCECPECAKIRDSDGTASSQVLQFANLVAAELRRKFPEALIYYFVYNNHGSIPEHVKPGPGVIPEITSWPSGDGLAVNQAKPLFSDYNRRYRQIFEWFAEHAEALAVYTYYGHYGFNAVPFPTTTQFVDDHRQWTRRTRLIAEQGEWHNNWGMQGITLYLLPRLMWNPELDVEAAIRDYCRKAYGKAQEPVREFFALLQRYMDERVSYLAGNKEEIPGYLPAELIAEADRLLVPVTPLLADMDENTRWRTQFLLDSWKYAKKYIRVMEVFQRGATPAARAEAWPLVQSMREFYRSDYGHWVTEYGSFLNGQLTEMEQALAVDLSAIPAGSSEWHANAYYGGPVKFYSSFSNLLPSMWGWLVEGKSVGELRLPLRAAPGLCFQSISGTVSGEMGTVEIFAEAPGLPRIRLGARNEAWVLPETFRGCESVTLVIRADNATTASQYVIGGFHLKFEVEAMPHL